MRHFVLISLAVAAAGMLDSAPARAHCDGLDGPVVTAARKALDAGDPNPILIWVQPADEADVRRAFADTLAVRKLGPQARELADRYFFETLVRVHRTGEGAPYTGLKPAGRDLGPAIRLADKAVASGSESDLVRFMLADAEQGLHQRFSDLQRKRTYQPDDLQAGRAYVASYVSFVHYVEALSEAARSKAVGHYEEGQQAVAEQHHPSSR